MLELNPKFYVEGGHRRVRQVMESVEEIQGRVARWLFIPLSIFVANLSQVTDKVLLLLDSPSVKEGVSLPDPLGEGKAESKMDGSSGGFGWSPLVLGWTAWAGSTLLRAGLQRVNGFIRARREARARRETPSAPEPEDDPDSVVIDVDRDIEEIELGAIPEPRYPTPTEREENASVSSWWQFLKTWWWAILVALSVIVIFACGQYLGDDFSVEFISI